MQYIERISAIETRAQEINLSLAKVCKRAGVSFSTVWRWQTGEVSPLQRTLDDHLGRLERTLECEEKKLKRLAS